MKLTKELSNEGKVWAGGALAIAFERGNLPLKANIIKDFCGQQRPEAHTYHVVTL